MTTLQLALRSPVQPSETIRYLLVRLMPLCREVYVSLNDEQYSPWARTYPARGCIVVCGEYIKYHWDSVHVDKLIVEPIAPGVAWQVLEQMYVQS